MARVKKSGILYIKIILKKYISVRCSYWLEVELARIQKDHELIRARSSYWQDVLLAKSAQNAADRVNSQRTKLREVVKFRIRNGQRLKWLEIEVARDRSGQSKSGQGSYWPQVVLARDRSGQKLRWPEVPRHSDGTASKVECAERPLVGNVRLG